MRYRLRTLLIAITGLAVLLGVVKAGLLFPFLLLLGPLCIVGGIVSAILCKRWALELLLGGLALMLIDFLLLPAVMR